MAHTAVTCKLRKVLSGHSQSVSSVKFAKTKPLIASSSSDATVRIWKTEGRAKTYIVLENEHMRGISDVAWSGCSSFVASASDDTKVILWDVEKGCCLLKFKGHMSYVQCVEFNQHSNIIASGSHDETVRLWDVRTGRSIRVVAAHSEPVCSLNFKHNGCELVSGGFDGLCRVWDILTGQCVYSLFNDQNVKLPPVSFVRFSPNGQFILTGYMGSTINLWHIAKQQTVRTYSGHMNKMRCIFSQFCAPIPPAKTHSFFVCGSEDGNIVTFDINSTKVVGKAQHHANAPILAIDAHPTRPMLVSGAMEPSNTIQLWDFAAVAAAEEMKD